MKKMIAMLLCAAMVLGIVGCAANSKSADVTAGMDSGASDVLQNSNSAGSVVGGSTPGKDSGGINAGGQNNAFTGYPDAGELYPVDDSDRDALTQIVEIVSGGNVSAEDAGKMDDEEIKDLVTDLLEQPGTGGAENDSGSDQNPTVDREEGSGDYDENGEMNKPFDQIYPDLVEDEEVEFDEASLLLKIANHRGTEITDGMKAAGVAALETVVPMEEYTWYEAKLIKGTDVDAAVAALRSLAEINMVDYNYKVQTAAMGEYEELPEGWSNNTQTSQQWYLNYCGVPSGTAELTYPGGSSSVIVAVIDTGVDYEHEDLAGNIWVNSAEIPDNGVDDDKNGYVDDYYGVNIITGKGNGGDDNGHGTHVAGIIAAENNNLGTVGIAYNVKVMPIKAAMASGYLLQSDIAKAILYAYEHGAEVINMSFGGAACSIAVQDALATAYTRCVLVASAGNEGVHNEGALSIPNYPAALTYVLGVMSVDGNGVESGFTNWDVLPFTNSEYELYAPGESMLSTIPGNRYASWSGTSMAAPVVAAMAALLRSEYTDRDTYPTKFIYGQLVGTSEDQAVCIDDYLNQQIHGPHNVPKIVNLHRALTVMPRPEVGMQSYDLFDTEGFELDTAGVNSGEGVIDAGETIALGLTLRNRWGMSKDTMVTIDTLSAAGIADPYITIHNPTVNYGSIGTYSTGDCGRIYTDELLTGWEDPFYITIAEDCPNDYIFVLNVSISCGNALDENDTNAYTSTGTIELEVRNGTILPTNIDEDMTLTKENLYIITNSTVIQEGVTVKVEPGTHIQFWSSDEEDTYAADYIAYLLVKGSLIVEGTAEEPVYIYPSDLHSNYCIEIAAYSNTGNVVLRYADVTNLGCYNEYTNNTGYDNTINYAENCVFRMNYVGSMTRRFVSSGTVRTQVDAQFYCVIKNAVNCAFYKVKGEVRGSYDGCIFADCALQYGAAPSSFYAGDDTKFTAHDCVFLGNTLTNESGYTYTSTMYASDIYSAHAYGVYYRAETGTTYVDSGRHGWEVYFEKLDGGRMAVETEEELNWITANLPAYVRCDIRYDWDKDCYTWWNGEPIGDFIKDPNNYLTTTTNLTALYLCGGELTTDSGYPSTQLMYEVPGEILPETIELTNYEITLDTASTYQLAPLSKPYQIPADMFCYESADENVVTVDEKGLITPVGLGSADVYIRSHDGAVSNYITVHVKEHIALQGIMFGQEAIELAVGKTAASGYMLLPVDATRQSVTFSSSDTAVAVVDAGGNISGVGSGTAVITATAEGHTAQMTVTVYNMITSLEIGKIAISGAVNAETNPLPAVTVSEGGEPSLVWESFDPTVADIENGQLVVKTPGVTTLKVTDVRSGLYDTVQLYANDDMVPQIVKLDISGVYDSYGASLLSDGRLMVWEDGEAPLCLMENVADFETYRGDDIIALLNDGTVVIFEIDDYLSNQTAFYHDLSELKPVGLGLYAPNYGGYNVACVYSEDGSVYFWGGSDYSSPVTLDGTNPVKLELDAKIVDVCMYGVNENNVLYLADNGDLYATRNNEAPILIARNVTDLIGTGYYVSDGVLYQNYYSVSSNYGPLPEYDMLHVADSIGVLARDGKVYSLSLSLYADPALTELDYSVAGAPQLTACRYWPSFYYVVGEDGLLYRMSADDHSVSIIPMGAYASDHLKLTQTNLTANLEGVNVLNTDTLTLKFNKELSGVTALVLYEDGVSIPVTYSTMLNELYITSNIGLVTDKTYRLAITTADIYGTGGTLLEADLDISFIYETDIPSETVTVTELQTDDAPDEWAELFALRSDGRLYSIESYDTGCAEPVLLLENVKTFDMVNHNTLKKASVFAALEDGTIVGLGEQMEEVLVLRDFAGREIVDIAVNYGTNYGNGLFVLLSDGTAYARHIHELSSTCSCNTYGQLGVGSADSFEGWKQVLVEEPIVQIEANTDATYFLSVSGYLYFAGGTELKTFTPVIVAEDVSYLAESGVYVTGGNLGCFYVWDTEAAVMENKNVYDSIFYSGRNGLVAVTGSTVYGLLRGTDGITEYLVEDTVLDTGLSSIVAAGSYMDLYDIDEEAGTADSVFTFFAAAADGKLYRITEDGAMTEVSVTVGTKAVHESRLDETVERYWTVKSVVAALNGIIDEYKLNHYFYNNVILNRLSTETDTSKWLRLQIGSTSSGSSVTVPIGCNYWGTVNETAIGLQIVDGNDFINYPVLAYAPYLTEAPESTFPFVTDITILNKYGEKVTTVGNEEITIRITFSRDMDTTVPLQLRFGSAIPYGDYEIEGAYVEPRVWEGKYTLNTLIENGNQYFNITSGQSANGLKLYADTARFTFVIDTTAAQALIMQGSATDTGIQLTWTQDDFDTLMGYNVYRSDSEDGYYQRLNETVIPADTMEFFDDTVEPGVVYYYNFTVVKTDLSESIPSGKISIMSKDTMAPDLYHTPVYSAFTGSNLVVSATVTDNLSVSTVKVYYRAVGDTQWKVAVMNKLNDKYSAIIPADQLTTAGLEYYIEATDGINITRKGSAEDPYQITIQEAVSSNSMGDVNGDGKISNLDALMLLQAINDLLNLDAEQFARADLNGDGKLTAAEALRILQYVSGAVGDLIMP